MKHVRAFILIAILAFVGAMIACQTEDCPPREEIERGTFEIGKSYGGAPSSGTVVIGQKQVEIVYFDLIGNMWHVEYAIISEDQ